MKHRIVIYRSRLLALSETFISNHYDQLSGFPRLLAGERRIPGLDLDGIDIAVNQPGADRVKTALFKLNPAGSELRAAIERFQPTLIHAHFATDAVDMVPIARALSVPLIVTLHGFDATTTASSHLKLGPSRWNYLLRRAQLFEHAHLFLAVSDYIRAEAIRNGFPAEKIVTHYLGTKILPPPPADQPREGILFVGRLVEKKGLKYLLQAAKILKNQGIEAQIKVIGAGPLDVELRNLAASLSIDVTFLGAKSHSEVMREMSRAKVFCMPSVPAASGDNEGFGLVYIEAQSMGTPVVAFNQGPVPEAVVHEHTGLLSPAMDVGDLAKNLKIMLNDSELRNKYSKNAIIYSNDNFNIKNIRNKLIQNYHNLLISQ